MNIPILYILYDGKKDSFTHVVFFKNSQGKEKVLGGVLCDGEAGPFEVHKGHG